MKPIQTAQKLRYWLLAQTVVSLILAIEDQLQETQLMKIRAGMRNVVGRNTALTTGEIVYATDSTTFGSVADGDDLTKTFDDIDDYHNHTTKLTIGAISTTGDYIDKDIIITTEVTYAKDLPLGGLNSSTITLDNFAKNKTSTQKHIKLVSVRLTSDSNITELDKNISMSAFSCNIGTYQPKGEYYK